MKPLNILLDILKKIRKKSTKQSDTTTDPTTAETEETIETEPKPETINKILGCLNSLSYDRFNYNDWLKIGMIIKNETNNINNFISEDYFNKLLEEFNIYEKEKLISQKIKLYSVVILRQMI